LYELHWIIFWSPSGEKFGQNVFFLKEKNAGLLSAVESRQVLVVVKRVFISVSCRFPQRNVCRQLASAHQNPLQFSHCFVVVVVDRLSQLITGFVVVGYERACLLACRVLCFLVSVVVVVVPLLEEIYWLCPSG
jgi:hypothetical protein